MKWLFTTFCVIPSNINQGTNSKHDTLHLKFKIHKQTMGQV